VIGNRLATATCHVVAESEDGSLKNEDGSSVKPNPNPVLEFKTRASAFASSFGVTGRRGLRLGKVEYLKNIPAG